MRTPTAHRRSLSRGTALFCNLLDALALQLDLGAAAGRQSIVRGSTAMGVRFTAWSIRTWSTSWVGATLGLAWVISVFRRGKRPPSNQ
ncbi:MAG: hypothetical protein KC438_08595 [Thermomicrobiales bacterium]|nr:hypothetical protein [Thermomicrobiales bacterium]MCO5220869.1 hypothetical protein [Thermomicrobiales bacterium]